MAFVPLVRFSKYHGLGNDFILIDSRKGRFWITPEVGRRLCDRKRGIGADGVLTILPSRHTAATDRMHVLNSDGSTPEMCGNGLRCVTHFLLHSRGELHARVDTDAGLREGWLERDGRVRVTLGTARLLEPRLEAEVAGGLRECTGLSLGNPHLVLRPFEPSTDLRELAARFGPELERHPRFPDRVNVGFASVLGPTTIRLAVFERGAGVTEACGTGAAAAAVALRRWGLVTDRGDVRVELPGGRLDVRVERGSSVSGAEDDIGSVEIVGDACHVFDGAIELDVADLHP